MLDNRGSVRFLSVLLLAAVAAAGHACATGKNAANAGGAGGAADASSNAESAGPGSTSTSGPGSQSSSGAGGAGGASSSSASSSSASSSSVGGGPDAGPDANDGGGGPTVTFMVVRVGDGAAVLSVAAAPVFLEQRQLDGTLVGNPLALPTAQSGNNQPLTLSGNLPSEGGLARAENGSCVTLGGYAAAVGTQAVGFTQSSTVNRVIGRVDVNGNVDTTTRLNAAFNGSNIRAAATEDGTAFWASGNGNGGTGGVYHIPLGAVGGAQILSIPNDARWTHVFAGQLYATSGSASYVNVFTVGAGLPTGAGQVATTLPGLPASGASPYAFALLDRDPNVPGVDTLYLSEDQPPLLGGGVQKWTFNGITWTKVTTFKQGITTGVRGVAAAVTGNDVTVVATTTEVTNNKVVVYVDDGALDPPGAVVAAAGANMVFRGVAFSPK